MNHIGELNEKVMTNDQINKAVALELGWKPKLEDGYLSMTGPKGNYVGKNYRGGLTEDHCWKVCNLDFCNDYNAAAEMRKSITDGVDRFRFLNQLMDDIEAASCWDAINATPRQQAEAFLKLRGKWVDHIPDDRKMA